jgi:hypothetical protein
VKGGSMVRDRFGGMPSANAQRSFQCSLVQPGDLVDEPGPVRVLQVQQRPEVPVEVVGEVGDLSPQLLQWVPG